MVVAAAIETYKLPSLDLDGLAQKVVWIGMASESARDRSDSDRYE